MRLDIASLLTVTAVNMLILSIVLPLIMGPAISAAARHAQRCIVLQACAWGAIIGASLALDRGSPEVDWLLSTLSIGCGAFAQWQLYLALEGWLGPRPWRRLLPVLVALTPLGYSLGFGHYAFRVGWANLLLAAVLLLVAHATLHPLKPTGLRWRQVLLCSLLVTAAFTAARGVLGAFTDQYPSFRTPHPVNLWAALATNASVVLGVVALLTAWREEAEQQLRRLAVTDGLTGLLNRRGFDERGVQLVSQAKQESLPLTALMLDIDHFKQINDRHGHEAGDRALQLFARLLCESGDNALVARLGGEEFGVLLAREGPNAGRPFEQALRTRLRREAPETLGFALDFSAGMASLEPGDPHLSSLLSRADGALYAAKTAGRGQLQIA